MITSRQAQLISPILEWKTIPEDTLVYFEETLRHRLHSAILDAFKRRVLERNLTQKELAKRIHKSPVTINRWLSTASNLTLDSISDLMVGLAMDFDEFPFTPIEKTMTSEELRQKTEKRLGFEKLPAKTITEGIQMPAVGSGKVDGFVKALQQQRGGRADDISRSWQRKIGVVAA